MSVDNDKTDKAREKTSFTFTRKNIYKKICVQNN